MGMDQKMNNRKRTVNGEMGENCDHTWPSPSNCKYDDQCDDDDLHENVVAADA